MQDLPPVAKWISKNYSSSEKIVEVGVGSRTKVLEGLKGELPECKLIATDIREVPVPEGVDFVLDDILEPDLSLYRDADLIYSLRTPPELCSSLAKLAGEIGADLLLKPLSSEETSKLGKLVNYSGASFYLLSPSDDN